MKCEACGFEELLEAFEDLLEEAMYLYQHYPNSFRKTVEEYFKHEIELRDKAKLKVEVEE